VKRARHPEARFRSIELQPHRPHTRSSLGRAPQRCSASVTSATRLNPAPVTIAITCATRP
jgi:hypothetical protein